MALDNFRFKIHQEILNRVVDETIRLAATKQERKALESRLALTSLRFALEIRKCRFQTVTLKLCDSESEDVLGFRDKMVDLEWRAKKKENSRWFDILRFRPGQQNTKLVPVRDLVQHVRIELSFPDPSTTARKATTGMHQNGDTHSTRRRSTFLTLQSTTSRIFPLLPTSCSREEAFLAFGRLI